MRLVCPHRIICDTVPAVRVGSQGTALAFASLIQLWRLLRASETVMHRVVIGRSVCTEPQCIKLTAVSSPKGLLCRNLSPLAFDTCMIRKRSISYRSVHTTLGSHCQNKLGPNHVTTVSSEKEKTLSFTDRALKFLGWLGGYYTRKAVLSRSAKTLYESCIDTVNYEAFFKVCNMPDSFQSWFLIAQLHLWLCMVRLKREGKDGDYLIKQVVSMFWYDVEQRMNVLGVRSSSVARKSLRELLHEFYGLTLAYEEGIMSDDRTLAAAVWRNLIRDKEETDPAQLAKVVEYMRKQVQHMDQLDSELLTTTGKIKLLPFSYDS